jgi:hypothetical protein
MSKQRLERREGWLPMSVKCSPEVLQMLAANGAEQNNEEKQGFIKLIII